MIYFPYLTYSHISHLSFTDKNLSRNYHYPYKRGVGGRGNVTMKMLIVGINFSFEKIRFVCVCLRKNSMLILGGVEDM